MSDNKTTASEAKVSDYIAGLPQARRQEAEELVKIMHQATGAPAVMWGTAIVGFGTHHYKYETGREGDICAVGFSVRKAALTLYGVIHYQEITQNEPLLPQLGTHKLGKGCLYIAKLKDIDAKILEKMVARAYIKRHNVA